MQIIEFTANSLGRPVRLGRPGAMAGLPDSLTGPQFAALAGLSHAVRQSAGELGGRRDWQGGTQGYLGRVGSWLRAGF